MGLLRRLIYLIVVLLIMYCIGWLALAWFVKDRFPQIVQRAAQQGVTIDYSDVKTSGFPFAFQVGLEGMKVTEARSNTVWQPSSTVTGGVSIFAPFTLSADVSGVHLISSDGLPATINVDERMLQISIDPLSRQLRTVDVDLPGVNLSVEGAGTVEVRDLRVKLDEVVDSRAPFSLSLGSVDLPAPFSMLAAPRDVSVRGEIFPQLPAGLRENQISFWQQESGLITIRSLAGRSEIAGSAKPLTWSGEGRLSLSPQLQPNANLDMRLTGVDEMLEKLVSLNVISADQVGFMKIGLMLFTRPAASGQGNEIAAPLVINNGAVVFGPVEVAKLPTIRWPQ